MTQVSKFPMSPKLENKISDLLIKIFLNNSSRTKLSNLLNEFLTPTEKLMLAKRVAISYMIAKKYDYRTISLLLKVSTNTITTTAAKYNHNENYKRMIDKMLNDREVANYWDSLAKKFTSLFAKSSKSGGWKVIDRKLEEQLYEPL